MAGSMVGGMVGIVLGVVWMVATSSMGAPGPFTLFGLVVIGFSIFGMVSGSNKSESYNSSRVLMEERRRTIQRKLDSAKRGGE